ncbi:TonB family protein [Labrys neptuniae]
MILVLAAHGIVVWFAYHWHPAIAMPNEALPAVELDLAPLAVSSPAAPEQAGAMQHVIEDKPLPMPQTQDAGKEDQGLAPQEKQEPGKPDPTPTEQPQANEKETPEAPPTLPTSVPAVLPVPENDKADSALAPLPAPKPRVRKKPSPKRTDAEPKRSVGPEKPRQPRAAMPSLDQARRPEMAAAPSTGSGGSPSASLSAWKRALIVHLNRFKRYPAGATGKGVVSVAITIVRSGQVLSARLAGSSGNAAFDGEAVALLRRASPVPAPPPGTGGGRSIFLIVPIHFGR